MRIGEVVSSLPKAAPVPLVFLILPSLILGVSCGEGPHGEASAGQGVDLSAKPNPTSAPTPEPPFSKFTLETEEKEVDLGRGEYLVAMLSLSCDHCEETVAELNQLSSDLEDVLPIAALCLGDDGELEAFRERTEPRFPIRVIDVLEFFDLIGEAPPRFHYLRMGESIRHWDDDVPTLESVVAALSGEVVKE